MFTSTSVLTIVEANDLLEGPGGGTRQVHHENTELLRRVVRARTEHERAKTVQRCSLAGPEIGSTSVGRNVEIVAWTSRHQSD